MTHRDARLALLEREKELTRLSDELARERAALPWTPIETEYVFDSEAGEQTLAELFGGRSQLIVYHFMFGPDWDEGCPSCSSIADHIEIPRVHLEHHDVTWVAVSRAPLEKLLAYRERMGWTFPWVSSLNSDFNFDFNVSHTPERPLREYNFREISELPPGASTELPGMSVLRAARRHGIPHLLGLRPRRGRDVGHLPVARPRAARPQRGRREPRLDAPPRPVPRDAGRVIAHVAGVPLEELLPLALASGSALLAHLRLLSRPRRAGSTRRDGDRPGR